MRIELKFDNEQFIICISQLIIKAKLLQHCNKSITHFTCIDTELWQLPATVLCTACSTQSSQSLYGRILQNPPKSRVQHNMTTGHEITVCYTALQACEVWIISSSSSRLAEACTRKTVHFLEVFHIAFSPLLCLTSVSGSDCKCVYLQQVSG